MNLVRYEEEVRKSDFCYFGTSSVHAKEALDIAGHLHDQQICKKIMKQINNKINEDCDEISIKCEHYHL